MMTMGLGNDNDEHDGDNDDNDVVKMMNDVLQSVPTSKKGRGNKFDNAPG